MAGWLAFLTIVAAQAPASVQGRVVLSTILRNPRIRPGNLRALDAQKASSFNKIAAHRALVTVWLHSRTDTKQGYLSFWNDNISYALRGCILIELALRRRIAMVRDPSRRRLALADRLIEVIDDRQTGETILDEALKMIKSSEKYGVGAWVDLMSGALAWQIGSDRDIANNCRRDVERHEDRLPAEAGPRASGQGPR